MAITEFTKKTFTDGEGEPLNATNVNRWENAINALNDGTVSNRGGEIDGDLEITGNLIVNGRVAQGSREYVQITRNTKATSDTIITDFENVYNYSSLFDYDLESGKIIMKQDINAIFIEFSAYVMASGGTSSLTLYKNGNAVSNSYASVYSASATVYKKILLTNLSKNDYFQLKGNYSGSNSYGGAENITFSAEKL